MDWWRPVDLYCERLGPDFWAEPVNALTNLAFVAAGLYGLARAVRAGADGLVRLLCLWVVAIGVGSFLFHTVATPWAGLADTLPIWSFVAVYVPFALRRFLGLTPGRVVLVLAIGVAVVAAVMAALPPRVSAASNGTVQYLPAVLALAAFTVELARRGLPAARPVAAAAAVFVPSLAARTADMAVCTALPLGTHFLWHLLNAAMLALLLVAAVDHGARAPGRGSAPAA